ncbi:echinoderm microtubule-associated protein-like 2 isoform X2 [Protopterus annectens]|uniref:echinoderm microtubule-associated protein-like 2 isoform X2 n=1 Tax=Protopterus annectens TaxID=7888 RepID=UPI001CFBDBF4|nr:echinoderm microtubule-associated protein-like 2 isoform X2 [Protopterus annectens]
MADDNLSDAGSMEMDDRISYLEQRLQLQEDEIQVLKAALADVLRRLNACEEYSVQINRKGPTRARQILQALPSKPNISNGILPQKRGGGLSTSPSSPKKEHPVSCGKSSRRSNSPEHLSSIKREIFGDSRSRTTSSSSSSSGKKTQDGKPKETVFSVDDGYVKMFLRGRPIMMYIPTTQKETYSLEAKAELPAQKLKLEWVYGYRGRDCRSNLYLLPTGEIVYFTASVVVLYNVEEQHQRHYLGHNDDIKCLAIHPDMVTIATGQVAGTSKEGKQLHPHVRVWDSVSLNTLHVIGTGVFDRAVSCLGFSKSNGGAYLCAVDESNEHILSVWEWQKEHKVAEVKSSNESVLASVFHPMDSNLIITCGKNNILFWTMEGNMLSKRQGLFEKHEKPKYVLCLAFAENGDVLTGDSSGNIYIWGKGGNRISHAVQGAHDGGVFGLCVLKDGTIVSGGGKDRKVILWDRDYHKVEEKEIPEIFGPVRTVTQGKDESLFVGTTRNAVLHGSFSTDFSTVVQGHSDELWGLDSHPSMAQFLTAGQDKLIHLWDTATHQPLWSKFIEDAACSAGFHPSGTVVALGTLTGKWMVFDTETKDLVTVHTDGNERISVMRYSPDGNYLAVGSHDNFIYLYAVTENGRKYCRNGKCSGHSSFVTHLDWSSDSHYIVTNSGDYEILCWDSANCKQVTSAETVRDIEWATSTCVLGFQVFGIWPEGSDGTDINAVCRSNNKKILATADDFGKVLIFSFPCCQPRAPAHKYGGHSSHVTNVAFLHDDSVLISTGGKDTSIMQWRVV